ncbi:MAG: tetratricopeptide repeat protein [Bacteroidales bacterium]|nr:tetratricopeptide repeat protein [Bacteroidales bacterium]
MNSSNLFKIGFIHVLIFLTSFIQAQQTRFYDDPKASLRTGLDLIEKEQYGAAQEVFNRLIDVLPAGESVMRLDAGFYDALCDYYLNHPQARDKFTDFVRLYPDHTKTNLALLHLGFIDYGLRKYKTALEYFEKVDPFRLSPEMLPEYLYKLGYSFIQREDFTKAKEAFFPILNTPSDYRDAANYYYAYIAYQEKDYQSALLYFEKIDKNSEFAQEVPFYLLQIYYVNNDTDQIVAKGPELLGRDIKDKKKAGELSRIVAEAYYKNSDYANAIVYLDKYVEDTRKPLTRDENYQLAYAHYSSGNFQKAIGYFEKSIKDKDLMSQNAHYHLADCYLQTGQKNFAQNAFYAAYQIPGNEELREDALFNYAKLTFELAYDPFNTSMAALNQYITDYPGSSRIDEAYKYLTNLFLSSRDYQASIDAMEKLKVKNKDLQSAYQLITFQRGVQLFNGGRYNLAVDNFRKSLNTNLNKELAARARFWLGESYFHMGEYPRAIDLYDAFLESSGASKLDIYPLAAYNLGYAYFRLKFYDNAVNSFKQFAIRPGKIGEDYVPDALIRIGDCYFITKNYAQSISFYEQAVNKNARESDYALFQKALSEGVQGRSDQKISSLQNMLNRFPQSSYADDATYEIAETYLLRNDNRNALDWFAKVTSLYPNSSYLYKSLQKTGMIHYNQNNYDQALEVLKRLVSNYPNSTEARDALLTIRNIYMDKNEVNKYFAYAETVPFAKVTTTEQDSITYIAAENFYMNNDCQSAIEAFERYIQQFENGAFMLNANYYKAECEWNTGRRNEALEGYEFVTRFSKSQFSENSFLRAGEIYFEDRNYEKALEYYSTLESIADYPVNITTAINGQMECHFRMNNYPEAIEAARKLRNRDRISSEQLIRSHYIAGKSAFLTDDFTLAKSEFDHTVSLSQGVLGAEAKYQLATIAFQQNEYTKAEELVIELASQYPSFEYWKAMGFILLSDVYVEQNNLFQAKQTLESILQYYPGQDLKEVAREKLVIINQMEQKQN